MVLLALALGHWSGRWSADVASGQSTGESEMQENGVGSRLSSSARSSSRSRRHSVSAGRVQSRQHKLDRILAGFYEDYSEWSHMDDGVVGDMGYNVSSDHRAWPKLCAWVMEASSSDFPAIMDMVQIEDGKDVHYDVMQLLIQRWVELDPGAALAWVKSGEVLDDEQMEMDVSLFLVQEAVEAPRGPSAMGPSLAGCSSET